MEIKSKGDNTKDMRIIFKNIKRVIKGHPKENLIIFLNMVLCTMTIFVLLQNYYFLKQHFDIVYGNEQLAHHYSIVLSDEDFKSKLSDMLNHSPMYYVGQEVDNSIMDMPQLSLYYCSFTRVYLDAFINKEQLEDYSIRDEALYNYMMSSGEDIECNYIDSLIVSNNCDEIFNLSVIEGRFFDDQDKNTNDPDIPIPIVLGNDFVDSFDVGEYIPLAGDTAVVIGILDENMYMNGWGTIEYLDDKILLLTPIFPRNFEIDVDSYEYQKNLIYNQVFCNDETIDVQKTINEITTENGYYTYEVQPIDGVEVSETKDVSAKNVALIGLLALVACSICVFSLGTVLYNRTVQDRSTLCIYLCCGMPLWKINLSLIIEMIIYLLASFLPTYLLSVIEYKKLLVPAWQILLFSGITILMSLIPVFKINKENSLDMLIRDKIV